MTKIPYTKSTYECYYCRRRTSDRGARVPDKEIYGGAVSRQEATTHLRLYLCSGACAASFLYSGFRLGGVPKTWQTIIRG